MNKRFIVRISLSVFTMLWAAQLSLAQQSDNAPPPRPRHSPPPEAIDACKDKTEGSEASFTLPNGHTVTGTCELRHGVLAVRPEGGPHRPPSDQGSPPNN